MAEWIETFKGVIDAREYDPNAHMNTQAYVSRFDQATWFLLAAVGLTPRTVRERLAWSRYCAQRSRRRKAGRRYADTFASTASGCARQSKRSANVRMKFTISTCKGNSNESFFLPFYVVARTRCASESSGGMPRPEF